MSCRRACLPALAIVLAAGPARAGTEDWQVNEVLVSAGGDVNIRYVELRNDPGGCLFPSSRIEVRDGDGALVGAVSPVPATTCYGAGTYFLLATPAAAEFYARTADSPLTTALPDGAGQICFASSTVHYDCVRYGTVADPITDFFGPDDTSTTLAPPDGVALARIATTNVVADDWALSDPTPRGPNDGTPWFPPDAGPTPDADVTPDAAPPDADLTPDAATPPDARPRADAANTTWLDLDPVGGASCDCRVGRRAPSPRAGWLLAAALLLARRRRRK